MHGIIPTIFENAKNGRKKTEEKPAVAVEEPRLEPVQEEPRTEPEKGGMGMGAVLTMILLGAGSRSFCDSFWKCLLKVPSTNPSSSRYAPAILSKQFRFNVMRLGNFSSGCYYFKIWKPKREEEEKSEKPED